MIEINKETATVRLISSDGTWIEGEALRQLHKTSELAGMRVAIGLPDLHPGKGSPVGAAFLTARMIYPFIIGSDAGCGVGLYGTSLKKDKVKRDKWVKKLRDLEMPWDRDLGGWLTQYGLEPTDHDPAHGTIGGGNHFAELQLIEQVHCRETLDELGIDPTRLMLLVHSGSRGMGERLLRLHTEKFGAGGLTEDSEEAMSYLAKHDTALVWAASNRALIASRFTEQLNSDCIKIIDACHNSMQQVSIDGDGYWLHRKGAAPSDKGPIAIPGSRGAFNYLVKPVGDQSSNLWSVAHGAGRKWNRSDARARMKSRYNAKALTQTRLGGVVICEDRDLLFAEAPEAYKNIESVIADLTGAGLIKVVATLRPLITYKVRQTP